MQMGERVIDENTTPRVLGHHTALMSTYCFSSSKSLETGKLVWDFFFSFPKYKSLKRFLKNFGQKDYSENRVWESTK